MIAGATIAACVVLIVLTGVGKGRSGDSAAAPSSIPAEPRGIQGAVPEAELTRLKTAVVLIEAHGFKGNERVKLLDIKTASGTGFFVDGDGLIATANHVIAASDGENKLGLTRRISVRILDQSMFEQVTCVVEDERRDLALIRIERKSPAFLALSSADRVPETTPVIVIGHPGKGSLAAEHTEAWSVTRGSITGRTVGPDGLEYYGVDARIETGSSGGPVLLAIGEVVGVADWKIRETAMNYAVPVQYLRKLIERARAVEGHACGLGTKRTW